jgi:uncharacterized membrane protein
MTDLLGSPAARLIFWFAALILVLLVGLCLLRVVARGCRDSTEQTETNSSLLAKFREMHHRGELSESEFRTIKTALAGRSSAEVKRKDDSS